MSRSLPLAAPFIALGDVAQQWAVQSQQQARRNAMVACTALAQRRAERDEVDDYFAARRTAPEAEQSTSAPTPRVRQG
ncbi:MAG: hypothetical protein F2667_03035 [Actinobacteria bacterium]|uniref:Unannotated protein n=1 Tax=freshwater metagenome TaxID=449393 RepID=A0A6J6P4U1_9ZZZZ|nr:hypothetical protein [Actinomycetota bacterium]